MNKKIISLILVLISVVSIAAGATIMFLDKDSANNKSENEQKGNIKLEDKEENKEPIKISYTNFSDSTDVNNLSIPLRWGNGYYVIKLNGEGLGNLFEKKYEKIEDTQTYNFYNDYVKIISYFNVSSDSDIRMYGLWDYGYMQITVDEYNPVYIQGATEYIEYTTIDSNNNYYLVKSKWINVNNVDYYIKIVNDNDVVQIYLGGIEENKAKQIFQTCVENTEICYILLENGSSVKKVTTYEGSDEKTDISDWTFLQTIIHQFYVERGIKIKNSIFIDGFNTTSYGLSATNAIHLTPVFELDNELYTAGITIGYLPDESYSNILDEEKWDSIDKKNYSTLKPIKLEQFKESYIYESKGEATLIVKTNEEKCYRIVTGITYKDDNGIDRVVSVINQLFY